MQVVHLLRGLAARGLFAWSLNTALALSLAHSSLALAVAHLAVALLQQAISALCGRQPRRATRPIQNSDDPTYREHQRLPHWEPIIQRHGASTRRAALPPLEDTFARRDP